jgi:hypothetical protein
LRQSHVLLSTGSDARGLGLGGGGGSFPKCPTSRHHYSPLLHTAVNFGAWGGRGNVRMNFVFPTVNNVSIYDTFNGVYVTLYSISPAHAIASKSYNYITLLFISFTEHVDWK